MTNQELELQRQKLLKEIENRKLPYLTPKDMQFEQLSKAKYPKLYLRQASCVPQEIHQKVQQGLTTLRDYECFAQDLVQMKGRDVLTPVYRLLVGEPGYTYRYLDTRLFAVPWPSHGVEVKYSSDEIGKACQAIKDLNEYLHVEAMKILLDRCSAEIKEIGFVEKAATSTLIEDSESVKDGTYHNKQSNLSAVLKDRTSFNVALLNYMDPLRMKYLKEEPYFEMGKMAVSWHHDENLVERSTVAVYSYSCDDLGPAADESNKKSIEGRDPALWHVGLKIAWDIATPGLALPLDPGDCYFMLDDLNMTHQHCVLSGMQPRFSSTHRVAECSHGTLDYIFGRCDVAMKNLQKDPLLGISSLTSLELAFVRQTEEIHNEVEFEWLRQFWFQGKRSAKESDWWFGPMAVLENSWREMEQMTKLLLCEINKAEWSLEKKHQIIRCLLPFLEERQELRKSWMASVCDHLRKPLRRVKEIVAGVSPDLPIICHLMSSQNVAHTGAMETLICLYPLTWKTLFHS
uniref:alpha-ketoglutarate-dependent dioxygenase FTO isoform X3 n=1 Tax=Pristiophorus japonicus TaxID=55135 RepID=UPI00398F7BF5